MKVKPILHPMIRKVSIFLTILPRRQSQRKRKSQRKINTTGMRPKTGDTLTS